MKLLADEGVDARIAASLRDHGHEMLGAFAVVSAGLVRIRQGFCGG